MLTSGKMRIARGEGRSQQGGELPEHFSHHYHHHHHLSPPGYTAKGCMTEEIISGEFKDNITLHLPR